MDREWPQGWFEAVVGREADGKDSRLWLVEHGWDGDVAVLRVMDGSKDGAMRRAGEDWRGRGGLGRGEGYVGRAGRVSGGKRICELGGFAGWRSRKKGSRLASTAPFVGEMRRGYSPGIW